MSKAPSKELFTRATKFFRIGITREKGKFRFSVYDLHELVSSDLLSAREVLAGLAFLDVDFDKELQK